MEDDDNGEESLAPEDKAMLSKFLVAALQAAKDDPNAENRVKAKGKKVKHYQNRSKSPFSHWCCRVGLAVWLKGLYTSQLFWQIC